MTGKPGVTVLFSCSALALSAACSSDDAPETAAAPLESAAPDAGSPEVPVLDAGPVEVGPVFLARKYADHFPIGAAVDPVSIQTHADLLGEHFNSVTPENDMKFESLQPTEGVFNFGAADAIVEF